MPPGKILQPFPLGSVVLSTQNVGSLDNVFIMCLSQNLWMEQLLSTFSLLKGNSNFQVLIK